MISVVLVGGPFNKQRWMVDDDQTILAIPITRGKSAASPVDARGVRVTKRVTYYRASFTSLKDGEWKRAIYFHPADVTEAEAIQMLLENYH